MKIPLLLTIAFLNFNNLLSQKLLRGSVLIDETHGYYGIYICDYSNLGTYTMVDQEGKFSMHLSDSARYIVTSRTPPTSSLFDNYDFLYKKFDIYGKDVLNLILTTEPNTFFSIPKSYKDKKVNASGEKYYLRYKADTLKTLIHKVEESRYKLKFNYSDCLVKISNYVYDNNIKDYRYLSRIEYHFDQHGAIREKIVDVEYGMHSSWEHSYLFYRNNKISRVETYSIKNLGKTEHTTNKGIEFDTLTRIVQNEILRKKLSSACNLHSFEFDDTFEEKE